LQRLALAADADERAIRRAYARELKLIDQERDLDGFQELRAAYEAALFWVRHPEAFADADPAPAGAPAAAAPTVKAAPPADDADAHPAPPAADAATPVDHAALPPFDPLPHATALPQAEDPIALGNAVFDEFCLRLPQLAEATGVPIESDAPWQRALQESLVDLRLFGIDARQQFELRVAILLAERWRPGHEALLVAAVEVFDWAADRRRVQRLGQAGALLDLAIDERALFDAQSDDDANHQRQLLQRLRVTDMPPTWRELALHAHTLEMMIARFPHWLAMVADVDTIVHWRRLNEAMPGWRRALALLGQKRAASQYKSPARSGYSWRWGWAVLVLILFMLRTLSHLGNDHSTGGPAAVPDGAAVLQEAEKNVAAGNYSAALTSLDLLIARQPNNAEAYALRAYAHHSDGKPQLADQDLERAAMLAPASATMLRSRTLIAIERKQLQNALTSARRAVQIEPDFYPGQLLLARVLIKMKQDTEALQQLEAMATAHPDQPLTYMAMFGIHDRQGDHDQAMAALNRGVAAAPDAILYLNRALQRSRGDRAGRERDFDSSLALTADPLTVLRERARWELADGRPDAAAATYGAAITHASGTDELPMLMAQRGVAYARAGKSPLADADIATARSSSAAASQQNDIAWLLATHGVALPTALELAQQALSKEPASAIYLDTSGFILLQLGREAEAVRQLDAALALRPDLANSLFVRGVARQRLGLHAAGKADLQSARAAEPGIDAEYAAYGVQPAPSSRRAL
ncbi:MAG: tetratricopeptide repeat protein, partial [Duganella sp.]